MDKSNGGRFSIASSTALGTLDRFVIDGNGNVGIGTTSPYAKLSVKGTGTGAGVTLQTTDSSNIPTFTVLDNGQASISSLTGTTVDSPILALGTSPTAGNYIAMYGGTADGSTMHIATTYWGSDGSLALGTNTTPDTMTLLPTKSRHRHHVAVCETVGGGGSSGSEFYRHEYDGDEYVCGRS